MAKIQGYQEVGQSLNLGFSTFQLRTAAPHL